MNSFAVEFTFSAPVVQPSEYPIHLDGLIAYSVMKELEELGEADPWAASADLSHILERTEGDSWVWKASMLIFSPAESFDFQNMIRKSDPERYMDDLTAGLWAPKREVRPETFRIDTRSGQQRGYQWLSPMQWMKSAVAYGIGDMEMVHEALSRLEYIGKMGRNGFGRISKIQVSEASDHVDAWKLRVLPPEIMGKEGIRYEPVQACLRAPYWRKTDRVKAQEPLLMAI